MTTSRASRAFTSDRRADEQKIREALAALSQTERLEVLRNVPLSRSVKLGGASRIVLGAKQLGLFGRRARRDPLLSAVTAPAASHHSTSTNQAQVAS